MIYKNKINGSLSLVNLIYFSIISLIFKYLSYDNLLRADVIFALKSDIDVFAYIIYDGFYEIL